MCSRNRSTFKDILTNHFGPKYRIRDEKIENATKVGENYCSDIYKVDFLLENVEDGLRKPVHAIAKCFNSGPEDCFRDYIASEFEKEIHFYAEIVPLIEEFISKQDKTETIDLFPKFFGYRKEVDDFVLLIENLETSGK